MSDYNSAKKIKGRIKGIMGELLFMDFMKTNIYSTNLCTREILDKLPFTIPIGLRRFLVEHWYSIDCFEIDAPKADGRYEFRNITLYEVKIKNYNPKFHSEKYGKFTFTNSEIEVYQKAQGLGMVVKLAKIRLFDNWRYTVNIHDFDHGKYNYLICNGSPSFQKSP